MELSDEIQRFFDEHPVNSMPEVTSETLIYAMQRIELLDEFITQPVDGVEYLVCTTDPHKILDLRAGLGLEEHTDIYTDTIANTPCQHFWLDGRHIKIESNAVMPAPFLPDSPVLLGGESYYVLQERSTRTYHETIVNDHTCVICFGLKKEAEAFRIAMGRTQTHRVVERRVSKLGANYLLVDGRLTEYRANDSTPPGSNAQGPSSSPSP